jgi:enterochelin esterase-like enzyme
MQWYLFLKIKVICTFIFRFAYLRQGVKPVFEPYHSRLYLPNLLLRKYLNCLLFMKNFFASKRFSSNSTFNIQHLALGLVATGVSLAAIAQPGRAQQLESPVVNADQTVTFKMRAPRADSVLLSAQFLKRSEHMTKDTSGVWSITVGPVKPDIYPYNFSVDGVSIADPSNPYVFPNERFKASLVDIKGETAPVYSLDNIPHGSVSYQYYYSNSLGLMRPLVVYTPPGYEENAKAKYPVLYLIHGMTDTEETWFKVGKVNIILDNLIAQKKAVPMIIVMPYANPYPDLLKKNKDTRVDLMGTDIFSREIRNEIIPVVEKRYRVNKDANNRAIAGFSLGGRQTLAAGLGHPETFSYVFAYAPAIFDRELADNMKNIYAPAAQLNDKLKIFWLSVGKEDGLSAGTRAFDNLLTQNNIKHQSLYSEGGHTWMNCRLYITETLPLLFKK